ncbi:MAG TPA: hypothetical protein VFF70_08035 [Anaerolineae bacterium]|nr:hypothetical protein [Anaerolineae bacterium]
MSNKALFPGVVVDEHGRALGVSMIGDEAQYVIDDNGFRRHIDAQTIDRQVLQTLQEQIEANKDIVEQQMLKMIGKDDLFTKAAVDQSLGNMDQVLERGLPDGALQWLGMMGFKIVVNLHGEVIKLDSPGVVDDSGDE